MTTWLEVCDRLSKALGKLKPDRIDLLETDNRILTIMLVSARFVGMRSITRFRLTDGMIKLKDPDLYRDFMFIYEAWTPAEFGSFQLKQRALPAPGNTALPGPSDVEDDFPVGNDIRHSPAE